MAMSIVADLYGPEFIVMRSAFSQFEARPVSSRVAAVTVATITGLVKPFILPLITAVGLLLLPVTAGLKAKNGDYQGAKNHLKAWVFCVLISGAIVAFLAVTTYHMPLVWSSATFVSMCALSIILHVRKALIYKENINYSD
ncbi:MAG: hypothetical protein S4CHLAM2_16820 [Chlamydiales bacterium]|nr:hypothetical protein [Chlamydiales bacterium]